MTTKRFSAPGKLVLCGEYAVTDGEPAVVAAVDRRAVAAVDDADELRVRGNDPRWLSVTSTMLDDESDDDGGGEQPLLVAVLREVTARGLPIARAHISVSTTEFSADGAKLGLGSSAAAAVALAAVFAHPLGTDAVHDIARKAHREFQGGGSGIDVAASTYGGVLRFQEGKAVEAPSLPKGLDVVVAWTGVSAQTQGFIDAYKAMSFRAVHAHEMTEATERFLAGCAAGDPVEVMRAIDDARRAMDRLGRDANLPIVTAEHKQIADLTRAAGGAAKPSGAGGGDVAVCFVPVHARGHLESTLAAAGFRVVALQLGAPGARMDRS